MRSGLGSHLHAQQPLDQLPLGELRGLAEQGDADAQVNLGIMYSNGRGVPQDDAEAVRWYRLAAEQGDANAQNNLGLMYSNGRGVPQDDTEAIRWYRLAADQGLAAAQSSGEDRDLAVKGRDIVAEHMTAEQVADRGPTPGARVDADARAMR